VSRAVDVRRIVEFDDLCRLRPSWDVVASLDAWATPFQFCDWSIAWWRHLRGDKRLAAYAGFQNGNLVAIFPMLRRTLSSGYSVLEFIGTRGTDYLGPAMVSHDVSIYKTMLDHVMDDGADCVAFEDVPSDHPMLACARVNATRRSWHADEWESSPTFQVHVPSSWDAYLRTLSTRSRRDILYDRRYLRRTHPSTLFTWDSSVEGLESFIRLHTVRWQAAGRPGSFASPEARAFIGDVAQHWMARRALRVGLLRVDGQAVAAIAAALARDRLFLLYFGRDPRYGRLSVGSVALGYCVEGAIENGLRIVDLSRGADAYKVRWGAQRFQNVGMVVGMDERSCAAYRQESVALGLATGFGPATL
jgi:CelD/BcsL family acetyltransferase involved in cellulose biosynthesis